MTNKFKLSGRFGRRMQFRAKTSSGRKSGGWRWLLGAAIVLIVVAIGHLPNRARIQAADSKSYFNFKDSRRVSVSFRGFDSATQALQSGQAVARTLATADLDANGTPELIAGYADGAGGILTIQRGNPDAFAPTDQSVFERLVRGYNPDSLLPNVEVYPLPEPADFVVIGSFDHRSGKDILVAAKGGGLYRMAGDTKGGFEAPEQIDLPGAVSFMAAGEFRAADGFTDVAVGVTSSGVNSLLIFDGLEGFSNPLAQYELTGPATAIEFGGLDDDPFQDLAAASGNEMLVVHGWGRKESVAPTARVERIRFGSKLRGLTIGEFTWDRDGRSEIAALTSDETVQIVERDKLDTRWFTEDEKAERTRGKMKAQRASTPLDVESVRSWQPGKGGGWTSAKSSPVGAVNPDCLKPLLRTHLARREMDDVMLISNDQSKLELLHPFGPNDPAPKEALSLIDGLAKVTMGVSSETVAVLQLPQKLNGVIDVVVLTSGIATPSIIPELPTAVITVDRTDDPSGAGLTAASACTAAGSDCSLRGAFQFANANPGSTIMLPANTYILSINGTSGGGCDGNTVGDLGANQSVTLTGAGAATTIIRQTGTGPANDGDRIMCMNEPFTIGLIYNYSGITFTGGREGSAVGGGAALGGAGIIGGELNNSLTLTSVTFTNNQETVAGSANLGGGGIQITGGNLIFTNCTLGGPNAPGAYADRSNVNTGNAQAGSGGGVTYTPSSPQHAAGTGTLTVTGTSFSRNTSTGIGGGGADLLIFAFAAPGGIGSGSGSISTSTFSNNSAANGGGIVVESLPTTVATTSLNNNSATNRGGAIYVGGLSLTLDGTSPSVTLSGNTATNGGTSISTASTVTLTGTNTTVGGSIEVSTGGTWNNAAGSTIAPTDVVITGGTFNCSSSTMNVSGNLSIVPAAIVGSTFNGNSGTVNIAGNFLFTPGGSGPATSFNAGTSTFNFNGTGAQSISNGASITFNNLTDSNVTQPLTLNNSLAVGGNLTVNGANATLAPVAATIISGGGTLTGSGTARVTRTAATADFSSQYTITNKTLTNLTVDYVGTAAQVLSPITFGPLKITNGNGVNLSGTSTVNGTLTLATGALNVLTNTLIINNGTSVGTGSLISSPTGTVNYNQGSAGQNVLAFNYGNLTFSNFNKNLAGTGTIGISGVFTTGTATGHSIAGSTIDFNGTGAQTIPAFNYFNLNTSANHGANNITLVNGGTIGIAGAFTPTATFSGGAGYVITNNTVDYNGSGAQQIQAFNYNNLTSSNVGARTLQNGGTIGIAGVFTVGGNTYTVTNSTVNFNGTGAQTIPQFNYNTLIISGARTTNSVTLVTGGTIGIAGAFNPTASFSTGNYVVANNTVDYNGAGAQTIAAFNYNSLTISGSRGANNVTLVNGGTIGIAGLFNPTATFGAGTYVVAGNTVDFNGGATQIIPAFNYNNLTSSSTGTRTLAPAGTIGVASVFTPGTNAYTIAGSTVVYNGASAQAMPSAFTTYNNLTLNNVAGVTGFAGLTVQGLLRVQAGTFTSSSTYNNVQIDSGATLAATAGSTINVGGTWTNSGTFTANTGTVIFNGSAAQTITGTTTFNNLTINNSSGVSFGASTNVTVGAALTLTSGALAIGANTLTLNAAATATGGSLTSAASGTVNYNQLTDGQAVLAANYGNLTFSNFNKTLPSSGSVGIAGTFTPGTAVAHTITGSTVDFNGAGSQTIPAFAYNNLTSSNSGARTLASSGNIRIAGAFTPGTNTYTITGSTLEYNGAAAQSLPSGFTPYNNLTLNNAAGVTGFSGLTVQGLIRVQSGTFTSSSTYKDVQIDAAGTLVAAAGSTINVSGTWTNNGLFTANDGTVNFNGGAAQSIGGSTTTVFNNLTINNASGVTLNASININATLTLTSGALAIGSRTLTLNNGIAITAGSFTSAANGTVNYNQSSNGQNVAPGNYGNLTFSNFTKVLPASGSVKIAGTFTVGATGGHTVTSSTVEYNGASAQALPSGFTTYNNLTLNNAAGVTGFSGLTVQGLLRVQQGTFTSSSNYNNVQIDSGATLSATAASTINIGGNWTNNGTFNANTGTVIFNGSSAQTISGTTTFNNLTINNASGVSLAASTNVTVGATLTLTAGAFGVASSSLTLNAEATATGGSLTSGAAGTVNYNQSSDGQAVLTANYGNLTFSNFTKTLPSSGTVRIAGAFTTGATGGHTITGSTVEFNGAAAQSLPAGFTTYDNLTVNNAAGISLGGNVTVNSALTFTNGTITTGANVLSVGSAGTTSRTSGHVIGSLKKTFSAPGSFVFHVGTANGYSPLNTTITAGTTDLTVLCTQGPQPNVVATTSLQRFWTLTATGNPTANLVFNYLQTDVLGDESAYRLIRVSGGTPVSLPNACPGSPCVDTALNTGTINGLSSFSDWTLGEPGGTTAAEDVTFEARGYDGGTYIEWRTGSEVDNLGFNIYRDDGDHRTPINSQIIAGSALVAGSGVRLGAGLSYGWWDPVAAKAGTQYWIEDIDLNGKRTLNGPILINKVEGPPSKTSSAAMLSQVGKTQSAASKPLPTTTSFASVRPDQLSLVGALAGQQAAKLVVKHDGFYRVASADLFAAGILPNADPEKLQMYADGKQIPIRVQTDAHGLISSVEFYGVGLDAASTDARVYWLISGSEAGLRMPQVKGSGSQSDAASFLQTIERRDRTIYFSSLRNGDRENFFGAVVASEPVDQMLMLPNLDSAASGQATVEVSLQGVTNSQHRVWTYINGTFAGELLFDGQSQGQTKLAVAQSQLREGSNVVRFVTQGGTSDISLVDYTRISYWHKFAADDNHLQLRVTGGQQTTVSGFTNSAVRVFDVTDLDSAEELVAKVESNKGVFSATFASTRSGERKLLAITDDSAERPAGISANRASSLRTQNHAADLVIITRRDFFPAFEGLAKLRSSQGIKTELIDAEDIYDEFSFGNKSPQAVKDFLQYARTNWKRGPRFVLLGGDSSYDPRNYLGFGDWDLAPSKLIDTALMETASDDWFVDFNNDGLPELAVGRLPVRSVEEAMSMVAKIVAYEQQPSSEEMLLIADVSDGFDFAQSNTSLKSLLPPSLRVNEINRGGSDPASDRSRLLDAINRGNKVVNYAGHGSVTSWRAEFLTSEDARLLQNVQHPSFFTLMTCLNGYGFDPSLDGLAESLIKAEGGAIAVWSSSGMTEPEEQTAMNRRLYGLMFGEGAGSMTIGEMVMRAKEGTSNSDIRKTWILIGDPTTKIR